MAAPLEVQVAERLAALTQARVAAEAVSQAKGDLLAMASHEIRTPLNGVLGMAELLARSNLSPYQADLVRTLRDASLDLLGLVNDLLDYAKAEAGRLELERTPVILRSLVEGACDALRPQAEAQNVRLHLFIDPGLPAQALLDGVRWRQILNNLVSNAVKFSAGRDQPGRVRVRVHKDGQQLRLTVADNGIGIGAEALAQLFRPFTQADPSTTRVFGGKGLGLSIVKRLVDAFDGGVEVQTQLGIGSTFVVSVALLPVDDGLASPQDGTLQGVQCHVCTVNAERGEDWSAYLRSGGARARLWPDEAALRNAIGGLAGEAGKAGRAGDPAGHTEQVVVLDVEGLEDRLPELRAVARSAGAGLVLLGGGQRRTPRRTSGAEIGLDANAMPLAALLEAVAMACGRVIHPAQAGCGEGDAAFADLARIARGLRVLVAEDQKINQEVIRRQFALLGVGVDLASDGRQALEMWRSGGYALLLADLHLPHLDGFGLVAQIRAEEAEAGDGRMTGESQRMPVIAFTAAVQPALEERCRRAGMDGCLVKPLTLERLAVAMRRWLAPWAAQDEGPAPAPDASASPAAAARVYDPGRLQNVVGCDRSAQQALMRAFLHAARVGQAEMRAALHDRLFDTAGAVAHRLRGAAASVGALALGEACAQVEAASSARDSQALAQAGGAFDKAMVELLDQFASPPAPAQPSMHPVQASVLIVDDDPFQLEVLGAQLANIVSTPAMLLSSAAEALAAIDGARPEPRLMLVDLDMPDMDGIELMRQLAARGYRGTLALMSAADERLLQSGVRLALEHGLRVVGHLHKPVSTEALRALVRRWQGELPTAIHPRKRPYGLASLREALARHRFVLHYQPQVRLGDGGLAGVEALLRWQHPRDGLVMPDRFIGLAEDHGLIGALTEEVLSLGLAQARRWRDLGLSVPMAVNVSMDSLVQLDFPDRVLTQLASKGLAPSDLVLEVTESRIMRDPRSALDILTRLGLRGVALAIDDFGTGHSSLAQLRDLPFNELKIDRGFVHDCASMATRRAIVAASIEMAHQLGMPVVAEGVENVADWSAMRGAGCDVAQGYYIARPMPGEQLPGWAAEFARRFRSESMGPPRRRRMASRSRVAAA